MSYRIETVDRAQYNVIKVCGTWTNESSGRIVDELLSIFSESPHTHVLVDSRGTKVETSLIADFSNAEECAKVLAGKVHKIASLNDKETKDIDSFFETVAMNRGVNMRIFCDEQEAIDWLVEGSSSGGSQN